jgi:hypothetical protein
MYDIPYTEYEVKAKKFSIEQAVNCSREFLKDAYGFDAHEMLKIIASYYDRKQKFTFKEINKETWLMTEEVLTAHPNLRRGRERVFKSS